MSEPIFERDIRNTDPNQTAHRKARFKDGWRNAVAGDEYAANTLRELTWENLGYRLGKLFGETSAERVDQMYVWCVDQQRDKQVIQ